MKKQQSLLGYVSALIIVIGAFMPWISSKASASFSSGGFGGAGFSGSYGGSVGGSLPGTQFADVILAILLTLVGCYLIFKQFKFTIAIGAYNIIIGLCHLFGWLGSEFKGGMSYGSSYGSAEYSTSNGIGLYVFLAGSAIFVASTLKYLKNSTTTGSPVVEHFGGVVKQVVSSVQQSVQNASQNNIQYKLSINGEASDMKNYEDLLLLAINGELKKSTLVWKPGMETWKEAGQIEELQSIFNNVTPPLPQ
ncbi:MAG: DUF4339 domain-containing protein [Chitinophagia bacterium]|nr:DUF4339 domain-containing protein [Chitinophagia bacterium]